jgi:Ca-activated chloride channel family protein
MELGNPAALALLALAPALALLLVARFRADRSPLRALVGARRFVRLYNVWLVTSFFTGALTIAFVVLAALALAEPRGGRRVVADERAGLDVVFLLDVSRSMLAADTQPTRLAAAISSAEALGAALPGPRIAVVAFKGEAYRMLPLTEDPEALALVLSAAGPDLSTSTGSNVEAGIRAALASLADAGRYRVIFLYSDGESLEGEAVQAARDARAAGVPVVPMAIGTEAGAQLVLSDGRTVFDRSGRPVVSRLDLRQLEDIAAASGGRVYRAQDSARAARELLPLLKGLGEKDWTQGVRAERRPLYRFFLSIGLALLLLARLVRVLRGRRMA